MNLLSDLDKVCVAKAREAGQGHIFEGWDELPPDAQQSLIGQVEAIDFQLLRRLVQQQFEGNAGSTATRVLKPAVLTHVPDATQDAADCEFARNLAEYALRNGEVLIVTASGGGSTFPQPVGHLAVGPVTGKTVYQLFAERIQALNRRYRISFRWHIFCHPAEVDATKDLFKSKGWFGLKSSTVTFLVQGLLPVVNRRGKIILCGPGRLAMSPSGHGSILLHYLRDDVLAGLEAAGIRHIFYHQVDNPLVQTADPVFLGLHIKEGGEISSKCVRKTDPEEPVGVFCQYNNTTGVVEYTEIPEGDRRALRPDGELTFSAANIGVHAIAVAFLRRLSEEGVQLPLHAVERRTPCLNRRGIVDTPSQPNSLGFRAFVFDALPLARRAVVVEVARSEEFSPIKDAAPSGPWTLESARQSLSRRYASWLRLAGRDVPPSPDPAEERRVEISPLYALDAEELARKGVPEIPATGDILIGGSP